MTYTFKTEYRKTLSDTHTPVALYLKLRDHFPGSFLLESSDYKSSENSFSYICLQSQSSFVVEGNKATVSYPDQKVATYDTATTDIAELLFNYSKSIEVETLPFHFLSAGLIGYTSYDAIPLYNPIELQNSNNDLPLIQYHFFRYIIVFDHFHSELYVIEHFYGDQTSGLNELVSLIENRSIPQYPFSMHGEEQSNFSNSDFLKIVEKGIGHCHKGDVFQVVLSRAYSQSFTGDDINVYRALCSINPSPYLFYFDFGNFKVFGSSPEAQLVIRNDKAVINPIAGTYKRTNDIKKDKELALELANDAKENAEHVMLVDLARNDLSKSSDQVEVDSYKEVEYYSHLLHLVSKVSARYNKEVNPIQILAETYPAGTLSGAPKHRAMQIIDELEPQSRGLYGGTIGFIGLSGDINHAICIRSFVSHNNVLHYQAGAGIVADSVPEKELAEVDNKLFALRKAIQLATQI